MNKKISVGLALALIIASVTATFAVTMSVSRRIYNGLISNLSERAEMYSSFSDLYSLISANYYYADTLDLNKIATSISDGYISGLGDESSVFLTASEYIEYNRRLAGTASGVGITTSWDKKQSKLVVTSVADGSSAATKGIKAGDVITKIGTEKVTPFNRDELLKTLEGDGLTTVDIVCSREGDIKEFQVTIGYNYVSVSSKMIGSVGYIRISAFYANTKQQLRQAVKEFTDSGVKGIIIDVRGTSTGSVEYAAAAVDCITPICSSENEVLVSLFDHAGKLKYSYPSTSSDVNAAMVVLVDGSTAGAAELFACDLRDFGKAQLVGETTRGVGTSQEIFTLEDGNAVLLTTSMIKPYKSESFDKTGLIPDYEVILDAEYAGQIDLLTQKEDAQLQKAISLLSAS